MQITVNVHAPDLARALEALALAIGQAGALPGRGHTEATAAQAPTSQAPALTAGQEQVPQAAPASAAPAQQGQTSPEQAEPETQAPAEPTPESAPAGEQPEIKYETVRAKLAELSRTGKQAHVKELLGNFGVTKLSDVPKERYAELLEAAEALA